MSREASGALSSRPIFTRYSGVTDSAMVSPIASWKPSLALSRKMHRLVLVGALIEVVAELVMDGREVFGRRLDAHLDAQVVLEIDVPGAGVADDLAILRPDEERALPERLRQRLEPERGVEALAGADHVERPASCARFRMSVSE